MNGFKYETVARFSDTDQYGVVHHSKYFCYLEEARFEMLEKVLGITLADLERLSLTVPVIHIEGKYIKSIMPREKITVYIMFHYTGTAKITYDYTITNAMGEIAFRGTSDHALVQKGKMLFGIPEELDSVLQEKMDVYPNYFCNDTK